jgi:hypothetical protein
VQSTSDATAFCNVGLSDHPSLGFTGTGSYTTQNCTKIDINGAKSGGFVDTWAKNQGLPVNVIDKGGSTVNTKPQNKIALQQAIADVNLAGGGVVNVPGFIDYGFVETDPSTYPDFAGVVNDMTVIDYSIGDADPAGNKTGAQVRYFFHTVQTSPAGIHNGNGHVLYSDWHTYFYAYNTKYIAPVGDPSRLPSDNLRASYLLGYRGMTTYRIGQSTLAGASYTTEELLNFVIESYAIPGDTLGNYAILTSERKTGNISLLGGTNAPQAALHVKSPSTGYVQGMYESLNTSCTVTLRNSSGASDDVSIRNNNSKYEVFFDTGVAMQIEQTNRNVGIGTDASSAYRLDLQDTASGAFVANIKNNSATNGNGVILDTASASGVGFSFLRIFADNQADEKYKFRGDGTATADVAWIGGGADRAEMFEWADGNPEGFDGEKSEVGSNRVGHSVTLVNGKIKICEAGEVPIGVVSLTYDSLGNAGLNWSGKYIKDDFGQYLAEPCQVVSWVERVKLKDFVEGQDAEYISSYDDKMKKDVEMLTKYAVPRQDEKWKEIEHSYHIDKLPDGLTPPEDAKITEVKRRVLNPDFDVAGGYTSRTARKEWDPVGILGICRLRKGQVVAPTWIKMEDVSENVEKWFIK